jgi:hypothetical protein
MRPNAANTADAKTVRLINIVRVHSELKYE